MFQAIFLMLMQLALNTGLNCLGPLRSRFFFSVNTGQYLTALITFSFLWLFHCKNTVQDAQDIESTCQQTVCVISKPPVDRRRQ